MPRVDNEVIINTPIKKIFDCIAQPRNLQQIWPSLVEIKNQELLPNGGYRYQWTYKIGIHFKGTGDCIGLVPNAVLASKNTGGIDSIVRFSIKGYSNQSNALV